MSVQTVAWLGFLAVVIIILAFALAILWQMIWGDGLKGLISEVPAPGQDPKDVKASLSRLQFLIFTFVIAGLYLLLSVEAGTFVDIPNNVLALMGISGGTYLVSKGVSSTQNTKKK
jgi:hypothetical protein